MTKLEPADEPVDLTALEGKTDVEIVLGAIYAIRMDTEQAKAAAVADPDLDAVATKAAVSDLLEAQRAVLYDVKAVEYAKVAAIDVPDVDTKDGAVVTDSVAVLPNGVVELRGHGGPFPTHDGVEWVLNIVNVPFLVPDPAGTVVRTIDTTEGGASGPTLVDVTYRYDPVAVLVASLNVAIRNAQQAAAREATKR